jgi:hypothetical protein
MQPMLESAVVHCCGCVELCCPQYGLVLPVADLITASCILMMCSSWQLMTLLLALCVHTCCREVLAPGGCILLLQTLVPEPGDRQHNSCEDGVAPGEGDGVDAMD